MRRLLTLSAALMLGACASNALHPPAELVDFDATASITRAWSVEVGDLSADLRYGLVPASDGTNVYVADSEGAVRAFRLSDGDEVWEHDTAGFSFWGDSGALRFSAGTAVADGRVAVGSRDGDVLALDAATGEALWQARVGGELLAQPLMAFGLIVLRTTDGRVVALDAATGEQRWDTLREVPTLTIRGLSTPVSDGQRIFVGFDNGKVAALAPEDGRMIWEATIAIPGGASELEEIVDVDGKLALFGNELYATSFNGNVAAIAVESGEVLWRRELSSVQAPAVGWGNVYATDVDSTVIGYDRLSGATAWTQSGMHDRELTGPVVFGSLLVVGDYDGYLHFLDISSGEMAARVSHTGDPVRARPLVVDDLLIVLSEDGELAAYRRADATDSGETG